jgi:hypothetical protein
MLRVENPKHDKNEGLRIVECRRHETGEERRLRSMWDRVLDHMETGGTDKKQ